MVVCKKIDLESQIKNISSQNLHNTSMLMRAYPSWNVFHIPLWYLQISKGAHSWNPLPVGKSMDIRSIFPSAPLVYWTLIFSQRFTFQEVVTFSVKLLFDINMILIWEYAKASHRQISKLIMNPKCCKELNGW